MEFEVTIKVEIEETEEQMPGNLSTLFLKSRTHKAIIFFFSVITPIVKSEPDTSIDERENNDLATCINNPTNEESLLECSNLSEGLLNDKAEIVITKEGAEVLEDVINDITLKKTRDSKGRIKKQCTCKECGKDYSSVSALNRHVRIHTGHKPYLCNICGKNFNQSSNLNTHYRTHTLEKQYSCTECGKCFNHSRTLNRHIKTHTGEKLLTFMVCGVCGKSFFGSSNFKAHYRIHTGERPYSCDVCGKTFIQRIGLKLHKRIHTGERLHSCSVCGKMFIQSSSLKRHHAVHTGI
ncbi:zinc finger protein 239-like [Leptidea sinapis]|uniref:zinc finger protein 239-like n=1 Tax=Leptidea sinapis TaxID=189913 RepID=UPI0021C492E1|nr:zinc finger protein 239-like [Leptidea sinapis]